MRFYWRIIFVALVVFCISSCAVVPKLPKEVNTHIQAFQDAPTPPFFMGEQDTVHSDGIPIWYESIGDKDAPTILLIMGHSTSGLAWSNRIIDPILEKGYRVIRYDNRDVGGSGWTTETYDLSDMAQDGIQILNKEGIDKAHVVGISMGGMIGQHLALEHPERVHTFSALATSGHYFDKELKSVTGKIIWAETLLRLRYGLIPKNERRKIKSTTRSMAYLQNQDVVPLEMMNWWIQRKKFAKQEKRKSNPKASSRHTKAIRASGSRLAQLKNITIPTLVIHGTTDRLILPEHGKKLASLLPNTELILIENMGHIPTPDDERKMSKEIAAFIVSQQKISEK